jgi:hypothetical protein
MVVYQERLANYGIKERGGFYVGLTQERIMYEVLPDPKKEDVTPIVIVRKEVNAFLP